MLIKLNFDSRKRRKKKGNNIRLVIITKIWACLSRRHFLYLFISYRYRAQGITLEGLHKIYLNYLFVGNIRGKETEKMNYSSRILFFRLQIHVHVTRGFRDAWYRLGRSSIRPSASLSQRRWYNWSRSSIAVWHHRRAP